ncbi:HEXXH motif domain-containing protein [Actinocrispum sp. NPDC049592]|uniref:HEXXH motif domain-containing protein n=1 Tax=Actinocrispum sp. NPDC049592 TaxID=3154835 RepID=UPI00342ADD2B
MVRRLRRAERSRRKLLLRALMEECAKSPELTGPLPPLDAAWELLARVEGWSSKAFDHLLTHPYTGTWAGYTTRLLRSGIDGTGPLWIHLGHLHALAGAAAIRAGLDFDVDVPAWSGNVALPSLGMARLATTAQFSVARVRGEDGRYTVSNEISAVRLPDPLDSETPGWWSVRRVHTRVGSHRFVLHLDDLDPYRGLYEPVPPQRLDTAEIANWQRLIGEACALIVKHLPTFAETMPIGLQSLVPKPQVPYRNPSASTGEAFGSAVVGRPTDGASLAATLIHEFQHIVLGGVLHLTRLYHADPRERIYVPWRDDPRPFSGAMQGVYAFFGVAAFWRALAGKSALATFEFAYSRLQSWRTLQELRNDEVLTGAGRRFLDGIAECLGPWQDEPTPDELATLAKAAARDHHAGWRIRHLRPHPTMVARLVDAWQSGRPRPPVITEGTELPPTPVPDGVWSRARTDLIRLNLSEARLSEVWNTVPDATIADLAYAEQRFADAADGYRAELAADPDRPTALVGLGLALSAIGPNPAGRALLRCPELVRAVHRQLRESGRPWPTPEEIAAWIGQLVSA